MEQTINSHHFNNLYNCRKNLLEILDNTGYDATDYQLFDMNELYSMIQNEQIDFHLKKKDQTNKCKNVQVHFYEMLGKTSKALRDKNVDELIEHYYYIQNVLTENDRLIIIVNDDPNDTLTQYLKQQWEKNKLLVNIISLKRLQFNILNHHIVPPHRILSDEEKAALMEQYNIREMKQMPEISRFDPVSQAMGIRPDDVCEIIRPSKTAITAPYYRICV